MPLTMSPAPATASISSESQIVRDRPNTTIAAPHTTIASMIARPWRRTSFARPDTRVAMKAPAAGAANSRPSTCASRAGSSVRATAGSSAIGNPKIIAFRSARKTDWIARLPFRNRNPSLTASQLTSFDSSDGGDGRMKRTATITARKVIASNTKAPEGAINAIATPAATGPSIPIAVPNPASSAFELGNSSGSRSRAGHVSSAGRLNV